MTSNISVIIPCFNAARYLRPAIDSVLTQTLSPVELIIVDDGSTDDSVAIASSYSAPQVHLIQKPHQGIAATRNVGVKHAKGDYLAFLDADDLWDYQKLEKQIALLKQQTNMHGVFGNLEQFISDDLPEAEQQRFSCTSAPQAGYHVGCLLISRDAFLQVGYFSESLQGGEFIEWYVRAKQQGLLFAMIDETVMHRRIHGTNTVLANAANINAEYLKIIKMKLNNRLAKA